MSRSCAQLFLSGSRCREQFDAGVGQTWGSVRTVCFVSEEFPYTAAVYRKHPDLEQLSAKIIRTARCTSLVLQCCTSTSSEHFRHTRLCDAELVADDGLGSERRVRREGEVAAESVHLSPE